MYIPILVISTSHHTFLEDSDASEDTSSSANDYSEIKSLPISILDYHLQEKSKEKFIVGFLRRYCLRQIFHYFIFLRFTTSI